jgi:hypothetical protein
VNINENVTLLPQNLFVNVLVLSEYLTVWKIYLKDDDKTCRKILQEVHNSSVGGHPGISNTWNLIKHKYEGPRLCQFIESYVKRCTKCQESKPITHMKCTSLYYLDTFIEQEPFQYVSIDLIMNLPSSNKFDSILMIVDQGCSKVAKFISYNKTIDG